MPTNTHDDVIINRTAARGGTLAYNLARSGLVITCCGDLVDLMVRMRIRHSRLRIPTRKMEPINIEKILLRRVDNE